MLIKKSTPKILFILSLCLFVWIFCGDPTKPVFAPPAIGNNSQIQTYENLTLNSAFGMYITATGTAPLLFQWYKNDVPVGAPHEGFDSIHSDFQNRRL